MSEPRNQCAECGSNNADHGLLCHDCRENEGYGYPEDNKEADQQ